MFFFEPKIKIDNEVITLGRKFSWWEIFISVLPLFFVISGGFLGALLGLISFYININICRNNNSILKKVILTLSSTILTFIILVIIAEILQKLISS